MSLTIERVLILRSTNVFSEVPEEDLLELAAGVEEIETRKGERIIEKGELGSSLYIVVDGKVRAHDGDQELRVLGSREIFGELAALAPPPPLCTECALPRVRRRRGSLSARRNAA